MAWTSNLPNNSARRQSAESRPLFDRLAKWRQPDWANSRPILGTQESFPLLGAENPGLACPVLKGVLTKMRANARARLTGKQLGQVVTARGLGGAASKEVWPGC